MKNNRIDNIDEYHFQKLDELKASLRKNNAEILDLSIGDPDIPTHEKILSALVEGFNYKDFYKYPPYDGIKLLKKSISDYYKEIYSVELEEDEIIVLIGSKEGIFNLIPAVCDFNDYAIIPQPAYPVYETSCLLWGVNSYKIALKEEDNYLYNLSNIPDEIANKSKLLIMNYPNNPTGAAANADFYRDMVKYCIDKNIILCNDGAYNEIIEPNKMPISLLQYDKEKKQSIEFGTFSKIYSMTGFRIGYAVGNSQIIKNILKIKSNSDSGQFIPIQLAAVEALKLDRQFVNSIRNIFWERICSIKEILKSKNISFYDGKGTFYIWCKVPDKYSCDEFCEKLINDYHIIVTPGNSFGNHYSNYFRISATEKKYNIIKFLSRVNIS